MKSNSVSYDQYEINDMPVPVRWQAYDFSRDVANIDNTTVRSILVDSGVMYIPTANPKIRVSERLSAPLQGLSALHEELCMEQKIADCPTVEQLVIDSIADQELMTDFVLTRLRMFGALCLLGSNETFAATHSVLLEAQKDLP